LGGVTGQAELGTEGVSNKPRGASSGLKWETIEKKQKVPPTP